MVCQTDAPWLDMAVDPCNVETFSGNGISQNIVLELKNDFTWDAFDIYLSIPHGVTFSIFQKVNNVEVNSPVYGVYETCTPCDSIEYSPDDTEFIQPICVVLPEMDATQKAYDSLYGSYLTLGYNATISFNEFYDTNILRIVNATQQCEKDFVLESVDTANVDEGFILLTSENQLNTDISKYHKLKLYNSSETFVDLQAILNAPSLSGGAWKFIVVKTGHGLSESMDSGEFWYVDPFWWNNGWNYKTQIDVAYPKGTMEALKSSAEFAGLHYEISADKFVGPRTTRVILPTGELADENKLQSDCDDIRFALEQLPLDPYSYAFPLEAEAGMSSYDNLYLYKNTKYIDDEDSWNSPYEFDVSKVGDSQWILHNDYDWEEYALMFIDDGDSDYFTITDTNTSAFPSLPSSISSPPLDRTYILMSVTLMDAVPRNGTYYVLDKMNWATSNGWAIGIKHSPELPNREYCPVFVNGNGTLNYYEGECHLTTDTSYKMTFAIAYDGDDNKLWIVQPDDLEQVISGFRDFSNTTEIFTLDTIGTSTVPLKLSSDNPERDFVGRLNYIEFLMPGDYLPRWTYISPKMQLLQNGFVELPFEFEGGKDTGPWTFDGECHTSSASSETGFLVSLPYTVRYSDSSLDFYQDRGNEEATETYCSDGAFGGCNKIMDGHGSAYTGYWDTTDGSTVWTYDEIMNAQAVAIVIDPSSSSGADITVNFNTSTTNLKTIQFTNVQAGTILNSDFRDDMVEMFDTLEVIVDGSAKIVEVEVLTSDLSVAEGDFIFYNMTTFNITSSEVLSNFQVDVTFDTAGPILNGNMQGDCDDIRFYDENLTVEIPYFISGTCNSGSTNIVVKIPSLPVGVTQIKMLYNSPTADNQEDPDAVYEVYDDFSGTVIDTDKWDVTTASSGTVTLNGGILETYCSVNHYCRAFITSNTTFSFPVSFEIRGTLPFVNAQTAIMGLNPIGNTNVERIMGIRQDGGSTNIHALYLGDSLDWQISDGIARSTSYFNFKVTTLYGTSKYYRNSLFKTLTGSNLTYSRARVGIVNSGSTKFATITSYTDWASVRKFATTLPTSAIDSTEAGVFILNPSSDIDTVKMLVFPTSSVTSGSQPVSVEHLGPSGESQGIHYFKLSESDIAGGTDEIQILIQKPVRIGGFYIHRFSSYGETSAKFVYYDDSYEEVNVGDSSTEYGISVADTSMFYNPLPDKKVKDIFISFTTKGATHAEEWKFLTFIEAPINTVDFLTPYTTISAYYGNADATAPTYDPHLSYVTRAFTPNLLFEFSADETTSVIYQSFTGGLASAVSGGSLWTSLLTSEPTITFGTWNGKTEDIEHEFVGEFWKGITSSGVATHAKITNLASYSDWGLGDHSCGYGYPVSKDGDDTFLDLSFSSPPGSLVNNGGVIWASSEFSCAGCRGQVETKAYNADFSSSMSVVGTGSYRCYGIFNFDEIELAFDNSNTAKFDWIKWYFTEPMHNWIVYSEEIVGDIDLSVDSVTAVPSQVVSGNYFDITSYVSSNGNPLGGATCQVIYAGDTYPMSETQTGKYEVSAPATYGIEDVSVSCSIGASADSGATTITVTLSDEDYITVESFTDLTSKLLAEGDKVAPLAFVDSNSFASMECEWYYESTPSSTTPMTSFSGNPFNYGPTAPTVYDFTDDIIVECCRGTYCDTGKMSHKLIESTTPYKTKTIYFGGELPLGGTFGVKSKVMSQGTETIDGSTDSFSEVIVPLDFANEIFGADVFSNPDNTIGGVIQFQGNNYTLTFDSATQYFVSQNITAPSTKAVFNYDIFVYYEVDDASKIWGHGIGQVYVGSEVPGISVDIIPTSPNVDITPISVDVEVYDIDNSTKVDSSCDLTITEDHTGAFSEYDMTQTQTGIHTISISDEFLGPTIVDVECYPSSTDYTPVDSEVGYTFGSNTMVLSADVNPDQISDGDELTVTATTSYGNFQTCGPDCSVWIDDELTISNMYCSNIDKTHSETFSYNTNESGAHNVKVKCDYGSDYAEATDSFQVSLGGTIILQLNPAENTELEPFTVTAEIKDSDNAPVEGLLCSAYVFEYMSGVSQTYAMSEIASGIYTKYIDEGWLGDLEVRVTCIDPASKYVIPSKQTSYNVGGYAPYTIGLFTAPQLPAQCSDDLQLQIFLLYREESGGDYLYPDCPAMTCEISAYDEDGIQISYMSAVPTLGKLRTAFLDLGGVCGTVTFDISCVDVNGTCTGGTRRAEVYLTDKKPDQDYCGNGICGRGEFETCDWDCDSFDKIATSSITIGDDINVIAYDKILTCRLDRDWADVSRVLPISYKCGSDGECTTRAMSTSIILMDDVSDYTTLPETLQFDFETPTSYIVDFGSMKASMPAETIFRNPAFVSDIQGIYGTYQYPLLLDIETGEDRIKLSRHSPTDIFGAVGAFYTQSYTCEPESNDACYGGLLLNKTTVTVTEYDSLTCWTSSGEIYANEIVQSFSFDPIKGEFNVISLIFNWKIWLLMLAVAPVAYGGISLILRKRESDIILQSAILNARGGR